MGFKLIDLQTVKDFWRVRAGDFNSEQEAGDQAEDGERPRFKRTVVTVQAWVDEATGHTHIAEIDPNVWVVKAGEFPTQAEAQENAEKGEVARPKALPPDFSETEAGDAHVAQVNERDPGPAQPWEQPRR